MPAASTRFPHLLSQVAEQPIPDLVRQFGTPLFVYEAAVIAQRIADLAAFDVVRYAQKANSNLAVLDLVRRHGAVVDAVSAGEIRRALAAGYQPGASPHPHIVYTADIFDREALDLVADLGIPVNCGSPDMIDQYAQRCPGQGITLRINPGFGHGHSQKTNTGGAQSKHGIWHTQLQECQQRAKRGDLTIDGLHMHIGSGTDMQHLSQVCGAMQTAALQVGPSIHTISAGGGLPTPYREQDQTVDLAGYYELWNATREHLAAQFGHPVHLEIEPGRYLAAECGSLITEIRAIKHMGENLFYVVDAGFNNLARPILYGAYHPIAVARANGSEVAEAQLPPNQLQEVVVGGPLCESGDIFTQEEGGFVATRPLPPAEVGDFLVIGCAGAYGAVMGSNYNSKPLAAEVLVEAGRAHLVRKRQTFDDIIQGEQIPPHD
jgi:diaminopimelate decarboxylase